MVEKIRLENFSYFIKELMFLSSTFNSCTMISGKLNTWRSWYHGRQPEVFLPHDSHCACQEVQILGSSKSIRYRKVEILRLKSCFLRMKETNLNANLWKTFSTELFCRRSWWFHVVLPVWFSWRCQSYPVKSVFTWRHGGHIGVPKQWHGGHVGVPNQSSGSWTFFLCKRFLLFQ